MTSRLIVAVALLLLWLDGGPGLESFVADAVRWSAIAAQSTLQSVAELVYDAIDSHFEPTDDVMRYVAYWLATAAAIVILATVAKEALLHALSTRWLQAWDLVGSRYVRGEKLAKAAAPDSHVPRSALKGCEDESRLTRSQRLVRRGAIAWRRPTSAAALRFAARAQYLGERLLEHGMNALRVFGGAFFKRPAISTALAPGVVVLASASVLAYRPLPHQVDWANARLTEAAHLLGGSAGRLLPFVALFAGLLLLGRATPLVDHIRARDEAAKEANRLIAQLYGAFVRLDLAIYDWHEALARDRSALVGEWVEHITDARYGWSYQGGLCDPLPQGWASSREQRFEREAAELETALGAVREIEDKLEQAGLTEIAIRLTWKVHGSLRELAVPAGSSRWTIRDAIPSPATIATCLEAHRPLLPWLEDDAISGDGFHEYRLAGDGAVRTAAQPKSMASQQAFEAELEEHAFGVARVVDCRLAELYRCRMHLVRVIGHLNRRLHGSLFTRSAAAIQK